MHPRPMLVQKSSMGLALNNNKSLQRTGYRPLLSFDAKWSLKNQVHIATIPIWELKWRL
jgi:hypothetical protein